MNTDKEIAAFVDRMGKRLNDSPKGSRRGRHRAAFIAVRPLIEAALCSGHTLKATWEALREEGKLSMTYESFRKYCRATGLGRETLPKSSADPPQAGNAGPASRVAAAARQLPSPAASSRTSTPAELPAAPDGAREFRHERVPRTDKIYG